MPSADLGNGSDNATAVTYNFRKINDSFYLFYHEKNTATLKKWLCFCNVKYKKILGSRAINLFQDIIYIFPLTFDHYQRKLHVLHGKLS